MALLMMHEDKKRELSFDLALSQPYVKRLPRKFQGAHVGFEMARSRTRFFFCCSGCGARLFRPQDLVQEREAVDVSTIDSASCFAVQDCDVTHGKERLVHSNVMTDSINEHWSFTVRTINCPGCRVYLGVKVVKAHQGATDVLASRNLEDTMAHIFGMQSECSISEPRAQWLALMGYNKQVSEVAWSKSVNQYYVATRYLRLRDAHTGKFEPEPLQLVCVDCDTTLSYSDQIVCYQRRWGFGENMPEPACYMNSVITEKVTVGHPYPEQLGQGPFTMADVWCKCGAQVGYKFMRDETASQRNKHHIGRYGLVNSCVRLKDESRMADSDEENEEELEDAHM